MKGNLKLLACTLPMLVLLGGCVASSSFYSARTLEEGQVAVTAGADDIFLKSTDKELQVDKHSPCAMSFGAAMGLPLRLELGVRYFPVSFIEASLRHQLNPRTFDIVDCSVNLHYGALVGRYSYLKYGMSISKNIHEFEPYVHYSAFHFLGSSSGIFDDSYFSGVEEQFINSNRIISFGIALPAQKRAKLYPEAGYQYFGNDLRHGVWHFGLGIRIFTGQGSTHE